MTTNHDIKVFLAGEDIFTAEDPTSIFRYYAQYRMLSNIYLAVIKPLQLQQKRRTRSMMKMTLLRIGAMLQKSSGVSSNQLRHKHTNLSFINEAKAMPANQAYTFVLPLLLLSITYCAIKIEEHHALGNASGLFGETTTLTTTGMLIPGSANEANPATTHGSTPFLPFNGAHADVHAVAGTGMSAFESIMSVSALSSNMINSAHHLTPAYDTSGSAFSGSTLTSDSALTTTSSDSSASSSISNPVMSGGDNITINYIDHSAGSMVTASGGNVDPIAINAATPAVDTTSSHVTNIVSSLPTTTISSGVDNILSSDHGLISNVTAPITQESSTILQPVVSPAVDVVNTISFDTSTLATTVIDNTSSVINTATNTVSNIVSDTTNLVTQTIAPNVSDVTQSITPLLSDVTQNIAPIVSDVTQTTTPIVSDVTQTTAPIISEVTQTTTPIVSDVTQTTAPIVSDVTQTTAPIVSEVTQAVTPVASDVTQPVADNIAAVTSTVASSVTSLISQDNPVLSVVTQPTETNTAATTSSPVTQTLSVSSLLDTTSNNTVTNTTEAPNTVATVSHQVIAQTTDLSLDHLVIQHQTHVSGH